MEQFYAIQIVDLESMRTINGSRIYKTFARACEEADKWIQTYYEDFLPPNREEMERDFNKNGGYVIYYEVEFRKFEIMSLLVED